MPAGSSTASSMESSLMDRCHLTKQLEEETILSTLSSQKLELENMCQEQSLLTLNQLLLMKFALEPIDNCSTLSNLSLGKRMPQITMPEDITPSERRLLIWFLTGSENLLINVQVCKDS